jgi:hypothetical protein
MIELLALPEWQTPATRLSEWVEAFRGRGHEVVASRESTGVSWVEVPSLRLRGYAVMSGEDVEAINFEIMGQNPSEALSLVTQVAAILGWEVTEDEGDEDDVDD